MVLDKDFDEKRKKIAIRKLLIDNFPREKDSLLPALHFIEEKFGYLPEWALEVLGWHLGVPLSEVYGASSSYTALNLYETNQLDLEICTGLSCHILGSDELIESIKHIGKNIGREISHRPVACAFLCSVGPVVKSGGDWFGKMTRTQLEHLVG